MNNNSSSPSTLNASPNAASNTDNTGFSSIFEFATATRIIFGTGAITQIGSILAGLKPKKILVVTGKTSKRTEPLTQNLNKFSIPYVIFNVEGEPTVESATEGLNFGKKEECDVVIGFGGGSSIDTGKAIAALLTNPGDFLDYMEVIGKGQALKNPSAPFIAIPTTSGTGAEVTRNAVLCSAQKQQKASLRSAFMLPSVALVDPALTLSCPSQVTASTGLDAFTQLLEPFVSNKFNPLTDAICREGLLRASRSLKKAYEDGNNVNAREDMALASLFGGLALANAKLGAVHGFAGVLGGIFPSAPHGAICAALLPHTIAVNVKALQERDPNGPYLKKFDEIAQIITNNPLANSNDAVQWISNLCKDLQIPGLQTYGIKLDQLDIIIEKSASSSSMQGNPIKLTKEELLEIITKSL